MARLSPPTRFLKGINIAHAVAALPNASTFFIRHPFSDAPPSCTATYFAALESGADREAAIISETFPKSRAVSGPAHSSALHHLIHSPGAFWRQQSPLLRPM